MTLPALRFALPLVVALPLTCGGTVSNAPCEGAIGPFTSPLPAPLPSFDVAFGTAETSMACAPAEPSECLYQLDIFLTPDTTVCPQGFPAPMDRDLRVLWIEVVVPDGDTFAGPYPVDSDPWSMALVGGYAYPASAFKPHAIVGSLLVPKGSVLENDGYPAMGAKGTVTISQFADGQNVRGSLDATFSDGTHLSGDLDVPFCTTACGAKTGQ